jgi:hypothetical protein
MLRNFDEQQGSAAKSICHQHMAPVLFSRTRTVQ